ncbi:MAG: hypothetical protein IKL48_02180 [Elusimicrobiaceae bacterium]|nr:hypothetical protein [Elusimicrobiaceae bacterium]MBR3603487.1 hypothetical protein [Elusimicrobiaceae bacterium]
MKKLLLALTALLVCGIGVNAQTAEKTNPAVHSGASAFQISGVQRTQLSFGESKLVFPKNLKATIEQYKDKKLTILGDSFSNVRLNAYTFQSKGKTKVSIDTQKNTITLLEGKKAFLTRDDGKKISLKKGKAFSFAQPNNTPTQDALQVTLQEEEPLQVPSFVISSETNTATQQAIQDVLSNPEP